MKTGSDILFKEPTCKTRRLRRSVVTEASGDTFSIRFVVEAFEFQLDQEVLMYFSGESEFMQQIGRIQEIIEREEGSDEGPTFVVEPVGDPMSAESRQTYRVSTISADLEARLEDDENLSVQDISAVGFAVLAGKEYSLGQILEVGISYQDNRCRGQASVQSIRSFGPHRIRYGLRAVEDDSHSGEFLQVLQRISLAVQREQLQRSGEDC